LQGATAELQNLHSELEIWKSDVHQQMTQPEGHEMSRDQKDEYFAQITTQQTELSNHLKRAVTLRFKGKCFTTWLLSSRLSSSTLMLG
jgi:hypothetical protein